MDVKRPALCEILGVEPREEFECEGSVYVVGRDGSLYLKCYEPGLSDGVVWMAATGPTVSFVINVRYEARRPEPEEPLDVRLTPDEEAVLRILCGAGFIAIKQDEDGALIGTFLDGSDICRAHYVSISKLFPSLIRPGRQAEMRKVLLEEGEDA